MGVTQIRFKPKLSKIQDLPVSFFMLDLLIVFSQITLITITNSKIQKGKHKTEVYT